MDVVTAQDVQTSNIGERITRLETIVNAIASWPGRNIDLKTAARLKGIRYNSLTSSEARWKRPNGGEPDMVINNRNYWRPETIREWILMDDAELKRRYKR